ncbi:histidine phosphatase family protein [Eubacterium sp. 1001713B170207_170306_E7]|uniref:histidine phosphatase family protein n=1 Tax=Eubacterium sp. 1001713B170207_170306_E7 TaxID=2787097 RepID=UPI001896B662|nr:histidine phosphatase family protein [Eubacterium sp. 1001713B170207_170306_E7]
MTTLYLIRHGTTDANANGIFQGVLDLPLNALGLRQAEALGKRFEDIDLDVLYCTPLQRTRQTAEGLRGCKELPILVEPGIVEVDGGLMEAKKISVIDEEFPGLMETFKTDLPNFQAPEGESTRDVYDRVTSALTHIVSENAGKTIACISHGFAIQTFLWYAKGLPFEEMQQEILRNTAVCKFVFDEDNRLEIAYINDDSHLSEDLKCEQPPEFRVDEQKN